MEVDVDRSNFAPLLENLFEGTNTSDGLSPIVFDEDGSIFESLFGSAGVLGFASPDTFDENGVPIEAVAFLNGGSVLEGFPLADFRGVEVHELGHYSGLGHTVVNGQNVVFGDQSGPTPFNTYGDAPLDQVEAMYPFIVVDGGQVTPHADDVAFLSFLYPAPGFFATSGTISGRILAADGATSLTGVNVIARNIQSPFSDAVSAISGDRGVSGEYSLHGLTPGASYTVHVDQILHGGFSTQPVVVSSSEEFYNAANESNDPDSDDPGEAVVVAVVAGSPTVGIDVILNAFSPGQALLLHINGSAEIFLPFRYEFCGQSYDSVFINENGNLTFGAGDHRAIGTTLRMLSGLPRIAAVWAQLDSRPLFGGEVTFSQTHNRFTVSYQNMPEFATVPGPDRTSFEITLNRSSGRIDIDYAEVNVAEFTAGVSCGGAVTSGFESESDLGSIGGSRIALRGRPAVFERFGPSNLGDLASSTLTFDGSARYHDGWAEPNDSIGAARKIRLPFSSIPERHFTQIEPAGGDIDYFRFEAVPGTTLVAEVLNGQADLVMCLFDPDGELLRADDDAGEGLLPKLVWPLQVDSPIRELRLAVSTFPDSDCSGDGSMHPILGAGRYVLDVFRMEGFRVELGDDTSQQLSLGFSFPFQGVDYTDVFVNSNGNLSFGEENADPIASIDKFLAQQPRIAALWLDLNPSVGGTVIANGDDTSMTVRFIDVPRFPNQGSNSFSVSLHSDGSVALVHGELSARHGLVGLTPGGGLPGGPGAVDLSTSATWSATGSTYESFRISPNPQDLGGTRHVYVP
jgi:hypothetical protein